MIKPDVLDALVAAGATAEMIAAAVKADLAADEARNVARRAKNAERQRRHRASRNATRDSALQGVTARDTVSPKESFPHTPFKENTPSSRSTNLSGSTTDIAREFASEFWPRYPHKIGKPRAAASFAKARQKADLQTIIAGLDHYVRDKPADRPWCNPETWLNQERWADQPAPSPVPLRQTTGPPTAEKNGFATISAALRNGHAPRQTAPAFDLDLTPDPPIAGVLPIGRFRA